MSRSQAIAGAFQSGLPYNRLGQGTRIVVILQGLQFENRALTG